MADLEAMEAAVDADDDPDVTHETGGSSSEVIRRVRLLEEAFKAGKLAGAPTASFTIFSQKRRERPLCCSTEAYACVRQGKRTCCSSIAYATAVGSEIGMPTEQSKEAGTS